MTTQTYEKGIVLIVDDNPTNLSLLFDFLADSGFKVLVARDGESAIQKVEYAPPDLILLDVIMPGIDGFETCQRLKANEVTKDIPVIFMTALADTVDKVKGLHLGAVDYITKPFQQEEVLARIDTHLSIRNLTKKLQEKNLRLQEEIEHRVEAEEALRSLTLDLENRVEARTIELSKANHLLTQEIQERRTAEVALQQSEAQLRMQAQYLEKALSDLKCTQTQLIQSEKMSSLGQLVAGVAHEINNPVNFIYGNLSHAKDYIEDLVHLLKNYQQNYPNPGFEIEAEIEEIELDFLIEDLPKLLLSMRIGAERIRQIVLSLRNFSHLDEAEMKEVDIHEGIDSTLMILQNRLKEKADRPAIEVIEEYSALPLVECYPGQLNQVFMNILANAIDALEMPNSRNKQLAMPTIRIRTEVTNDNFVKLSISDNGSGMTENVSSKIFDPFFTTKTVGKGTGIGLSISHQIVEKHGGNIRCISVPGEGTEFIIEIPVRQSVQISHLQKATF